MNIKKTTVIILVIVLALLFVYFVKKYPTQEPSVPLSPGVPNISEDVWDEDIFPLGVVAENLNIPWDIGFVPDGSLLVTERPGNLVQIFSDGERKSISIPRVIHRGEGGLLGLVLHPSFESNNFLYLYMTVGQDSLGTRNAVIRYKFEEGALLDELLIRDNIPGAIYHDGGRMEFGPDGLLYITTGDATSPDIAQDLNSLGGKILRIKDDGTIPSDNPFGTAVYSYGHRNPQGITWDSAGRLWSTEHGRSGALSGLDEINLIVAGANYGWPTIEGDAVRDGMKAPSAHSGSNETWAPASAMYWDGSVFFGGLRGEALYEAVLNGALVREVKTHLKGEYGRLRTVRLGPDGIFYLTTSNTDGRGSANPGDDKIIRIDPKVFR